MGSAGLDLEHKEFRVLSATGMLGSGFKHGSFACGLEMRPHLIGVDAGWTYGGTYYLATGEPYFPDAAVNGDLGIHFRAAVESHIPFVVGSALMSGADQSADGVVSIVTGQL